jgi:N-carbamoyl-L-amino-acid hydrolase
MPDDFERMWAELGLIGRSPSSGGYFRQPFTAPERELRAWFDEQASARHLRLEEDGFGNAVAWWDAPPGGDEAPVAPAIPPAGHSGLPRLLVGSHLDSVLDGGAFDGPLGVVSSFAALDRLRERGVVPTRSVGVASFVEEEGSRFGLACLGSRLATGATSWERARELRDRDGTAYGDVVEGGSSALLDGVDCFVELHVEQGRDLVDRGRAIGVASRIWPHGRYRVDVTGTPNHAGTTRMEDRHDPMLTYAMTALAANKQARVTGQRATFGRLETMPNSTNSVPSTVTAWMDVRAETDDRLAELVAAITRQAEERAGRDGTTLTITAESVSGATEFDSGLAERIATDHAEGDWPVIATQAGHDAGILSARGIPSAMLFVRNPTGVSHSPAEHAEVADCLAGVDALAETIERLTT